MTAFLLVTRITISHGDAQISPPPSACTSCCSLLAVEIVSFAACHDWFASTLPIIASTPGFSVILLYKNFVKSSTRVLRQGVHKSKFRGHWYECGMHLAAGCASKYAAHITTTMIILSNYNPGTCFCKKFEGTATRGRDVRLCCDGRDVQLNVDHLVRAGDRACPTSS